MKRSLSVLLIFSLLLGLLCTPCAALVTEAQPPLAAGEAALRWSYVPGTSYRDAPSVPAWYADKVYVMHHKTLDCLDAASGKVERSGSMTSAPSYAIVPALCTQDSVYCPLGGGTVQAFARDTLASRWIYTDPLGGQALTEIVTDGACVYTGFWNEENEEAAFVCLDGKTGACLWRVTRMGGFYFATCLVVGGVVLLGGDNGTAGDGDGLLLSIDKATGETLDSLAISGDNRSAITAYEGAYYLTTKVGMLYKIRLQNGKLTLDSSVRLPGASTSAPIGYDGKLYLGVQEGRAGSVLTLDADSLKTLQSMRTAGYPQAEMLLVSGDKPKLILTCNTPPGCLYTADPETGTVQTLYEPPEGMQGYCISPVQAMPDGTLLYKNDSGAVFAVEKKPVRLTFWQRLAARLRAFWQRILSWFTGGVK
ncbi:MAG: PQQ-binding-like beta-propeller repeat protein [Clostridia bacterium]|nr:PQQ-binding-like beta-propeller repeat protein [Clostridia bacterium]